METAPLADPDLAGLRRFIGGSAAALFAGSGLLTIASLALPVSQGLNRGGVAGTGLAAIILGIVLWWLPWSQWSRAATLWLVPVALTLIAVHNHFASTEPFRYGIFFVVAFTWLGVSHPPGMSLRFAPLLALAYLVPLWTSDYHSGPAVSSALYAVPLCLLVGETLALLSERLRVSEVEIQERAGDARFRSLIQNASDMVSILDRECIRRYISPACERILGVPPDELLGQHAAAIDHPDDAPLTRRFYAQLAQRPGEVDAFECRVLHHDGSVHWLEVVATNRLNDPTVGRFVVNSRDVTERKRTEQALHESEEKFRAIVDTTAEWIWEIDCTGQHIYSNPAVETILGYRPDELIGRDSLADLHEDDGRTFEAMLPNLLAEKRGWTGLVRRWRHKDGTFRFLESNALPILDASGELVGWRGSDRDITARKRVEAERAVLLATELEHVGRLTDLAVLRADFMAMVAHELGSPIAAIRRYAELLAIDARQVDPAQAVAAIQDEVELLRALVADVQTAAAVERDDFAVRLETIPVAELLADAAAFAQTLPGDHSVAVEIKADGRVAADPHRTGQVLRNLLSNAVKYSPPGSPITLRAAQEDQRLRIDVVDQGYGIHPDDLDRVFAKFGRGRDTQGQAVAGLGLGLYLSRRIVRAHGGELSVTSTPGTGSTFGFSLEVVA